MKLLGIYDQDTGNDCFNFLKTKGIEAEVENVSTYNIGTSFHKPLGGDVLELKLFVDENDYEQAALLIKEFRLKNNAMVEVEGKKADKVMLKLFIGLFVVFGMIIYIGCKLKWW